MQDFNWKNWLLLFILAIGISFELMKRFPGRNAPDVIDGEIPLRPNQPYSVKVKPSALPQRLRANPVNVGGVTQAERAILEKFLARNTPPGTTTFAEGKDKAGEGKKKDEKCDEKGMKLDPKTGKPLLDPKTGKPAECKKKKKKKKPEEKKSEPPPPPAKEEAKSPDFDANLLYAMNTGQLPEPLPDKPDSPFDSLEEWIRRLLNSPDMAETKRFIDHYQRNLVTAEVFFKITQMMIDDPREKMRQLGIMCAGVTPSLLSFQMLAHVWKTERSGSAVRTYAEGFLARYSDLNNLTTLERILRAPGASYVTVLATQKLDQSANRYLVLPTANGAGVTAAQVTAVRRSAGHFRRFITLLQQLTRSSDASVKDQAGHTLNTIQTLIASAQSAAPGPVPSVTPPPGQTPTQQPAGGDAVTPLPTTSAAIQ